MYFYYNCQKNEKISKDGKNKNLGKYVFTKTEKNMVNTDKTTCDK